jgi:CheY-like chemotaxis protein
VLRAILEIGHYRVLVAANGAEATEIARSSAVNIDVIVSDVLLGPENGPTVAAQVREFFPEARLLLISGYPLEMLYEQDSALRQYVENQRAAFVQKPFMSRTIVQIVDSMLGGTSSVMMAGAEGAI